MGYINDISCCELTTDARERLCKRPTDPIGVVVKFAPKDSWLKLSRLEFVASNTIMSELKITPKLIYVDESCIINEYVEVRNF